jgi:MFS family permease
LVTGRLGSIYGHQNLVLAGCALFSVFVLANAFCRDYISFVAIRALAGVGGGMFMPNAVAIMTTVIPPGRSRNLALGFFSAAPPIGGVIGALLAGLFIEIVGWKWLFILM